LVIYVRVTTKRKFSLSNLDAKLAELGNHTPWTIEKDGESVRVMRRKDGQKYPGRVRIGEIPEQKLIYASGVSPASAHAEERLTGSWTEWMIRYFSKKMAIIEIFPDKAKVGKEE
jgi:hypothetical protein